MKALQVTLGDGAHKLALANVPKPTIEKPGQVLVKVMAAAVNPSDIMNTKGLFPHTTFPRIVGRDFAGIVVEPNDSPMYGKEVYGTSGKTLSFTIDGAYAEFVLVTEDTIAPKPSNLSFAQAGAVGVPYTAASLTVRRSELRPDETVLVIGATGQVGTAVTQIATEMGCKVLTASRSPKSSINLKEDPGLLTAKDLTSGKGVDVVIDAVGDLTLTHTALSALSNGGRLAFISVGPSKTQEMSVNMRDLYRREISLVGCNTGGRDAEEMAGWLAEMSPLFETGALKTISDSEFSKIRIEDYAQAFDGSKKGKFIIDFE